MHLYSASIHTAKDFGVDKDLSLHMLKFEDIPINSKQDNDRFHTF